MSQSEFEQIVNEAKARLCKTIKFGDQDWKVTPFHFVVGDIIQVPVNDEGEDWMFKHEHILERWWMITTAWHNGLSNEGSWAGFLESPHFASYVYPCDWYKWVTRWRQTGARRRNSKWMLSFTNNPLIVNELQPEEVSLASVENDKLTLTNFTDLPNVVEGFKIYQLGEFWLSHIQSKLEVNR